MIHGLSGLPSVNKDIIIIIIIIVTSTLPFLLEHKGVPPQASTAPVPKPTTLSSNSVQGPGNN